MSSISPNIVRQYSAILACWRGLQGADVGGVQLLHSTLLAIVLCSPMTQIRGSGIWGGRDAGRRALSPKEIVRRPGRELEDMAKRRGNDCGEGSSRWEMWKG